MKKKETISEKIKKKFSLTSVAKKYNTDLAYVSLIARGKRTPVRGKGLEIKKRIGTISKINRYE